MCKLYTIKCFIIKFQLDFFSLFLQAAQKIDPNKWRDLMPLTRDVARKLRREGRLEICQHGTVLISDAWTGPIRLRLPFQTQKLVTCKPRQSAGATEALAASAGVLCQSPEVTVSENRGGAKCPRDSDGHGDRVTMSVNRSSSLVVKKRGGPRSQRTLMAKTDKLECVYKP